MSNQQTDQPRHRTGLDILGYTWVVLVGITVAFMLASAVFPQFGIIKYLFLGTGLVMLALALILVVAYVVSSGEQKAEEELPKWVKWLALALLCALITIRPAMRAGSSLQALWVMVSIMAVTMLAFSIIAYGIPLLVARAASHDRQRSPSPRIEEMCTFIAYILLLAWGYWLSEGTAGIYRRLSGLTLQRVAVSIGFYAVAIVTLLALMALANYMARRITARRAANEDDSNE